MQKPCAREWGIVNREGDDINHFGGLSLSPLPFTDLSQLVLFTFYPSLAPLLLRDQVIKKVGEQARLAVDV